MTAKSSLKSLRKAQKLHANGQMRLAIPLYQQAIKKAGESGNKEAFAHSLYGCGVALVAMKMYEGGTEFLEHALVYDPTSQACIYNLAMAYHAMGEIEKAKENYHKVLALNPDFILANANLGSIYYTEGEPEKGFIHHSIALATPTNNDEDKAGRALIRLLRGQYKLGWEESSCRWTLPAIIELNPRPKTGRAWKGEALDGKPICVYHEQGAGDSIMMSRYIIKLFELGRNCGPVTFMVQPELKRLFTDFYTGLDVTVVERKDPCPEFYWHVPTMSLPLALKSYEPAPVHKISIEGRNYAPQLPPLEEGEKLTVGIQWMGSRAHMNAHERNARIPDLKPLFDVKGVRWVSLQHPEEPDAPKGLLAMPFSDMAETAGAIVQCDLVIAIDSSVGHLAGTLGKRTWLMAPTAPEFRWLLDRTDSVWYPDTHTLYRRTKSSAWKEMISRMAIDLQQEVDHRRRD